MVAALEQLGELGIQLVRNDDLDSRKLALFKVPRGEAAKSVVATQRIAIADYENLPHRFLLMR